MLCVCQAFPGKARPPWNLLTPVEAAPLAEVSALWGEREKKMENREPKEIDRTFETLHEI